VSKNNDAAVLKALGKDEKVTIKVMYYSEQSFFQEYGNLFFSKFPNVDIEVVSSQGIYGDGKDPQTELDKLIVEKKPDVLMLDISQYEKMAGAGKLLGLDAVIKKDKFDIENISPAITDILRSKGSGTLYGLAPTFYSNALMYNKDLFDQNGVELPRDQMNWSEVLELAKRFPIDGDEDKRIYGFFQNLYGPASFFQFVSMIGGAEKLSVVDPESLKVTIDTAMTISSYSMIDQIKQAKDLIKDYKPFNWDMVTVPVDPKNPDVTSTSFGLYSLFAINAQSSEQRAAWEFIKYLNSDEFARIMSHSTQQLLSRTSYIKDKEGRNVEALYKLKADTSVYQNYGNLPRSFSLSQIVDDAMKPVLEGKKTLDEVLPIIQAKGQEALDKAKVEDEAKK
jgi:multiple sugar transport system substrate-binding protein